jgi:hypothetical protein
MTHNDMIRIDATDRHNHCKDAIIAALRADNMSFWESVAILSSIFGSGAILVSADPVDVLQTIVKNFEEGYNATASNVGPLQ